ncbi:MAG: peptidase M15, partial [Rhizobiales bacterium]|nr:peptidase M15 [Hyphomicrobiales bacterium]
EYDHYWHISAIKFGRRVMRNYNKLIDRYPGADGMKTGFICASGYNLVASATRNGKRLIAVVLGASSGKERTEVAAGMLERGFNGGALAWLTPSLGTVESLKTIAAEPPNLREEICGRNRKARTDHAEEEENQPQANSDGDSASAFASVLPGAQAIDRASLIGPLQPSEPPTVVNVIAPPGAPADPDRLVAGPKKKKLAVGKGRNGRKTAVINVSKPAAGEKKTSAASAKQKPAAHKPAPKQAAHPAKPAAPAPKQAAHAPKPAGAKSAAHDDRPRGLAAPAKPKPAAQKPAAQKPAAQKPAAKPKSGERSASAQ